MTNPGPTNSITDIKGLKVGNAQDENLKSGVTVLLCDEPATASDGRTWWWSRNARY